MNNMLVVSSKLFNVAKIIKISETSKGLGKKNGREMWLPAYEVVESATWALFITGAVAVATLACTTTRAIFAIGVFARAIAVMTRA